MRRVSGLKGRSSTICNDSDYAKQRKNSDPKLYLGILWKIEKLLAVVLSMCNLPWQ